MRCGWSSGNAGQHGSHWQVIAAKTGCPAHALNEWVRKAGVDSGKPVGIPSGMAGKMKALERESRELRPANGILRKGERDGFMTRARALDDVADIDPNETS